jgi:lipoprotein signal peptidase
MIRNYGISFGNNIPGLYLVNIIMIVVLFVWWWRSRNWRILLIIIGGGLNFLERLRYGYIIDYWKVPVIGVYNNINDWLIFIGVVLCLWQYLRVRK